MRAKTTWRSVAWAAALAASGLGATSAGAVTFKYAFQGDLNALDAYSINETFTIGAMSNVMEALTTRGKDLSIQPSLAERWEVIDPLKWRFYLRKGVKFHGGEPFTADDVLFSLQRVRSPDSQIKSRVPADMEAVKVDDYTVDFVLKTPNPILHAEWDSWHIWSKSYCEKNGCDQVQSPKATSLQPFALKSNGTGAFMIVEHVPGVKTVFKPNPNWWGKKEHNLDEVIFQTIKSDATRVAALLSGEIDMMDPVPLQDIDRVNASGNARAMTGPEIRTIFLNFDQFRDELLYSSVKGKNPFKDVRVRKAFYQAIDIEAIKTKVMRGSSTPAALMITPAFFKRAGEFKRLPYDVDAAKKLMTEAGYPDGFELQMDCPNDRYVNDEAICQAVTSMLARINVKAKLNAQPKAKFFEKCGPTRGNPYDCSFSLLGWSPGSGDSWNVIASHATCRDKDGNGKVSPAAQASYGGYCNPKVDELSLKILTETDIAKRDQLIVDAYKIMTDEVSHIPLHQQALAWGVSKKVDIVQRADNQILFYWATKKE
jgi:peptide/nickel transport system substrate-binding protein